MSSTATAVVSAVLSALVAVVVGLGIAVARTRERVARLEAFVEALRRNGHRSS